MWDAKTRWNTDVTHHSRRIILNPDIIDNVDNSLIMNYIFLLINIPERYLFVSKVFANTYNLLVYIVYYTEIIFAARRFVYWYKNLDFMFVSCGNVLIKSRRFVVRVDCRLLILLYIELSSLVSMKKVQTRSSAVQS